MEDTKRKALISKAMSELGKLSGKKKDRQHFVNMAHASWKNRRDRKKSPDSVSPSPRRENPMHQGLL
jgi:hypothetical protein